MTKRPCLRASHISKTVKKKCLNGGRYFLKASWSTVITPNVFIFITLASNVQYGNGMSHSYYYFQWEERGPWAFEEVTTTAARSEVKEQVLSLLEEILELGLSQRLACHGGSCQKAWLVLAGWRPPVPRCPFWEYPRGIAMCLEEVSNLPEVPILGEG